VHLLEGVMQPVWHPEGLLERALIRLFFENEIALAWIRRAIPRALNLYRQQPYQTVLSTFPPTQAHLVAYFLKRKLGVKWVADFRDPIAENPYRKATGSHGWMDRRLERLIFDNADALIANTDGVLAKWKARFPQHASKMHLIWNGYDPDEPMAAAPLPSSGPRILGHFGCIYGNRHLGQVLESLRRLIGRGLVDPDTVRVLQQGTIEGVFATPVFHPLREELRQLGCLEERDFLAPRAEAIELQKTVHYLVLPDTPGEKSVQLPAKVFEYVRIGRPILAVTTPGSPVERLLAETGIPHVCIYYQSSEEETDRKLIEFLALAPLPAPMAAAFAARFDGRRQTEQLAGILNGLSGESLKTRPAGPNVHAGSPPRRESLKTPCSQ
jgi:glycosyltransferase involved in cell wall biosynthesis